VLERRIHEITERISRLMDGFDSGMMKKEDFQPRYNGLVEEREMNRRIMAVLAFLEASGPSR
jgi:hypothetical protein